MDTIYEITDHSSAEELKDKNLNNIVINNNEKSSNSVNKNRKKYLDKNIRSNAKHNHKHIPKNGQYLWTIITGDSFRNQMMYCNRSK